MSPELAEAIGDNQYAFGMTASLSDSEAFMWFSSNCLAQKISEWKKIALDPTKTSEDRTIAVHVLSVIQDIYEWTKKTNEESAEFIRNNTVQR